MKPYGAHPQKQNPSSSVLMEAKAGQFIASLKKAQETTLGLRRVGKGPRVKVLLTY